MLGDKEGAEPETIIHCDDERGEEQLRCRSNSVINVQSDNVLGVYVLTSFPEITKITI